MNKETKKLAASGLGLTGGAVIWLYATFALNSDLRELEDRFEEDHDRLIVVDHVLMGQQERASEPYE